MKPAKDPAVCLVRVLNDYFSKVRVPDCAPCFSYHNEKGVIKALTYKQLNEQIKMWTEKTGHYGNFTSHCLCRGGINHALRCGISPEYLQIMGDWMSQCFLVYIDFALDLRLDLVEKIAQQ